MNLQKEEELMINGGFKLSGTLLNAFSRAFGSILDLGRSFGTTLRMLKEGRFCAL